MARLWDQRAMTPKPLIREYEGESGPSQPSSALSARNERKEIDVTCDLGVHVRKLGSEGLTNDRIEEALTQGTPLDLQVFGNNC